MIKKELDTNDLFERLKKSLGCDYISDIKCQPYIRRAKVLMRKMNLEEYSLHDLNDMAIYLYGKNEKFQSIVQAKKFFGNPLHIQEVDCILKEII